MTVLSPRLETNMNHLLSILLVALAILAAPAAAQSIKTLGFNASNGVVVANTGTNALSFELGNGVVIGGDNGTKLTVNGEGLWFYSQPQAVNVLHIPADDTVQLNGGYWNDPSIRASLGFSTNLNTLWTATNATNARSAVGLGATWLTNTNVTNFRTAIGLGATNAVTFQSASVADGVVVQETTLTAFGIDAAPWGGGQLDFEEMQFFGNGFNSWDFGGSGIYNAGAFAFANTTNAASTRTNLGLGLAALTNTSSITMMRAFSGSTNTNHPYSGSISVTGTNNTNTLVFSNGILQSVQ